MSYPSLEAPAADAAPLAVRVPMELLEELRRRDDEIYAILDGISGKLDALVQGGVSLIPPDADVLTASPAAENHLAYEEMIVRLRSAARELPAGAKVLVISKGDPELLRLGTCDAKHFPQGPDGSYSGYHPADSAAAIAHLETLREQGAEYLVVPSTSAWWLTHYRDFAQHLATRCRLVLRQETVATIYDLRQDKTGGAAAAPDSAYDQFKAQLRTLVCSLLPEKARLAVVSKGDPDLLAFPGLNAEHFPQAEDGQYAWHHPADSAAAIAQVETLRTAGTQYLLIPTPSAWWLDYYADFRQHLETRGRLVIRQKHLGVLFALPSVGDVQT